MYGKFRGVSVVDSGDRNVLFAELSKCKLVSEIEEAAVATAQGSTSMYSSTAIHFSSMTA